MRTAVITFPGSNCDRDMAVALEAMCGTPPLRLWHASENLPKDLDLVVLPGGFSYGDYLRPGALAARSPLIQDLKQFARKGGYVLGVCNGFQVLTEIGLLPGALMRNIHGKFVCADVRLNTPHKHGAFIDQHVPHEIVLPIACHDGNYVADDETLKRLEGENQIALTYADENPVGAARHIAGIYDAGGRVLGMMPHPERSVDAATVGGTHGRYIFESFLRSAR